MFCYRSTSVTLLLLGAVHLFLAPRTKASGPGNENDFHGHRVLIIGIDGCRRDVMEQLIKEGSVPNLAKLQAGSRAFWNMEAGGEPTGVRNQPTISGPGWSTILTGVFADKHGVLGNGPKFSAGHFDDYPHVFKHIRDEKPGAWLGSIVGDTWPEVNTILISGSGKGLTDELQSAPAEKVGEGAKARKLCDGNVAKEAVRCLTEENPDVLFLHFLDVDHAGHQFGFAPTCMMYVDALKTLDGYVGNVTAAIHARPQLKHESWLIIVITDHGGIRRGHGAQSPEERQIFAFFNGPGFDPAELSAGRTFQTLVTPTILDFLGIRIDPAWHLESPPEKPSDKRPATVPLTPEK